MTATGAQEPAGIGIVDSAGESLTDSAGESLADGLDRLWTPHRMTYISGEERPTEGTEQPAGCPFCIAPGRPEEDTLVVARGST